MRLLSTFLGMAILFCLPLNKTIAQCNAPTNLYLSSGQTFTTLPLQWPLAVPTPLNYDIRYWSTLATGDKTIVKNFAAGTAITKTLTGLKHSTTYVLQIRSSCTGGTTSAWFNAPANHGTSFGSGTCTNATGVVGSAPSSTSIKATWTSTGSHSIRYKKSTDTDWTMPVAGLNFTGSGSTGFTVTGLTPGTYTIAVKRNCSTQSSNYVEAIIIPNCNITFVRGAQTPGVCRLYTMTLQSGTALNGVNVNINTLPGNGYSPAGSNTSPGTSWAFTAPTFATTGTWSLPTVAANTTYTLNLNYCFSTPFTCPSYTTNISNCSSGTATCTAFAPNPDMPGRTSVVNRSADEKDEPILLRPNPANDIITIDLTQYLKSRVNLSIINLSGKVVYENKLVVENEIQEINVQQLPNGIYLFRAYNDNGLESKQKFEILRE